MCELSTLAATCAILESSPREVCKDGLCIAILMGNGSRWQTYPSTLNCLSIAALTASTPSPRGRRGRKVKIESPYTVLQVISQRQFPMLGYVFRREVIFDDHSLDWRLRPKAHSGLVLVSVPVLTMENCYSLDSGHWIGNKRTASFLCRKRGLRQIQKANLDHCVASIGFDPKRKKWAGWSHRAICSFGIGDRIFEEDYGKDGSEDSAPFVKHGRRPIRSLKQAKVAAASFAGYVS